MNSKKMPDIVSYSVITIIYLILWTPVSFIIAGFWTRLILSQFPDHNLIAFVWKYANFFIVFLIIFFIPCGIYYSEEEKRESQQCLNCMSKKI